MPSRHEAVVRVDAGGGAQDVNIKVGKGASRFSECNERLYVLEQVGDFDVLATTKPDEPFESFAHSSLPPPMDVRVWPAVTFWRRRSSPASAEFWQAWREELKAAPVHCASNGSVQQIVSARLTFAAEECAGCDDYEEWSETSESEEESESDSVESDLSNDDFVVEEDFEIIDGAP